MSTHTHTHLIYNGHAHPPAQAYCAFSAFGQASLIDSFLMLVSKGLGMVVKIDDVEKLQQDLKNDYINNHELSSLAGGIALSCRRWLALASAALITTKHVQLEAEPEPDLLDLHNTAPVTHPSRDKEGYPLEGLDEVC